MELKDFLPEEVKKQETKKPVEIVKQIEKIGQDQLYDMITSKEASWQAIIYELRSYHLRFQ